MTPLLQLDGLAVHFRGRRNWRGRRPPPVRAVDGVSLDIGVGSPGTELEFAL